MSTPMMKCGHSANAQTMDGKPACVICAGLNEPAAHEVVETPDLTGRTAYCAYYRHCGSKQPSSTDLAFFEIGRMVQGEKHENEDSYYCGCRGWD